MASVDQFSYYYDKGMNTNRYQTYQCDKIGLSSYLIVPGILAGSPLAASFWSSPDGVKAKATSVEAIAGAIWEDSKLNGLVLSVVCRHMGFYWPENAEQHETLRFHIDEWRRSG